jgi:FtsZ-interacting cell division protein YlmF
LFSYFSFSTESKTTQQQHHHQPPQIQAQEQTQTQSQQQRQQEETQTKSESMPFYQTANVATQSSQSGRGSVVLMKTLVPTKPADHRPSTITPPQNDYLPTESVHDRRIEESESFL